MRKEHPRERILFTSSSDSGLKGVGGLACTLLTADPLTREYRNPKVLFEVQFNWSRGGLLLVNGWETRTTTICLLNSSKLINKVVVQLTPVPRDIGGFFFSPVVRFRRRVFATSSPILEDCRSFMFLRSGIPELTRSSVVEWKEPRYRHTWRLNGIAWTEESSSGPRLIVCC